MSDSMRNEQTRPAEATDGGLIRLGCCYCDRTDCDGIGTFPTGWRNFQEVKAKGLGLWETHSVYVPNAKSSKTMTLRLSTRDFHHGKTAKLSLKSQIRFTP